MNIVIIDCGIGNRIAIKNMLRHIGHHAKITRDIQDIKSADLLILPGVGAFDAFMQALVALNLVSIINQLVLRKKVPILGICLGMQILFESSEEGTVNGFGWIKGKVESIRKFYNDTDIKLPHIGWKKVHFIDEKMSRMRNNYYFVHNYVCSPVDAKNIAGQVELHGKKITVAVQQDNIYGVQFHPEKSHKFGLEFFENFINHVNN